MIGQILGAVGGLATTYLDGKVAVQKANAEIKVKQATGEIDWDLAAIQATQNSWKVAGKSKRKRDNTINSLKNWKRLFYVCQKRCSKELKKQCSIIGSVGSLVLHQVIRTLMLTRIKILDIIDDLRYYCFNYKRLLN